ncbi:MAG: HNH endonuclease [Actinobacteria bacterium]|nr:HNH endonuclease [Actinomycetota bacterium]
MPCKQAKARHLIRDKKAKVVRCNPFTIRLNWDCEKNIQPVTLGVDTGYLKIGFSAITNTQELISGEVQLRKDVSKKISERRTYRRARRSRKLWHRKSRFDNRVSAKKKDWLAPSIQHKLDTHIKAIDKIKKILPITQINIEVATFDTQKMQNPKIRGTEYQQGELQGYEQKEYLLEKWYRKCAYCGKTNVPLEVEHIVPKSRGGSDRISNLTIACNKCNQKKGNKTAKEFGYHEIQEKANKSLKEVAFMNNVRWKLVNQLKEQGNKVSHTYGYITKYNRAKLGLEKSHSNDSFVIANGISQKRCKPFIATQTRRNNRSIQTNRKGFKPSIRRQRYKFQPNDMVRFNKKIYKVKGVFNYGKWVRLSDDSNIIDTNIKNVSLITYGKGLQFKYPIHLPPNSNDFERSLLG